jgi:hypothetical protein
MDSRLGRQIKEQATMNAIQPIAGGDFLEKRSGVVPDPYRCFIDLMAVVEAFCPKWNERTTFKDGDRFLL